MRDELMAADADGRVAVYLGDGETWDRQAAVVFHGPLDWTIGEEPRFQARYVVGVDALVRFWLKHGGYDASNTKPEISDAANDRGVTDGA